MDVRQLRYFVSVVELRSFSRAAEALHVAQPALGMQIRKLEDELHTQLLSRHSRGVEPTEAGNLLRDRAVEILRRVDATRQEIRDFAGPPRGVVQVGITPSTRPGFTTELIQRVSAELPTIQVVVQEAMNSTMLEWVRSQRVDFALVHFAGDTPGELMADELGREWAVFARRREPGRQPPDTITLADLCQQPLVMPPYPHHLRRLLESMAVRHGLMPQIGYEVESFSTTLEMVERSLAGCVLPFGAVARHVAEGRLVARTVVEPRLPLIMSLVHSRKCTMSKAQILLRGLITELVTGDPVGSEPVIADAG